MYKRILLKLSGEALSSKDDIFVRSVLDDIAYQIQTITEMGVEVAVVVGGGNFVRGRMADELGIDRIQVDYMGMLGTVINALAVQGALESRGVETRVQTAVDMHKIAEPFIVRRAIRHLEKGRVVIFAAGTGSTFFSTDTASALRAFEVKAEVILMAKNGVDGVYDSDPNVNPDAKRYDELTFSDLFASGLQVIDQTAASMCADNDIDLLVFNMNEKDNIIKAVKGETTLTRITKGGKN